MVDADKAKPATLQQGEEKKHPSLSPHPYLLLVLLLASGACGHLPFGILAMAVYTSQPLGAQSIEGS